MLGERYLWVDFYCIDQQNPNGRKAQIDNMDLIYQGAYLTLIAQDGSDCHVGLPGMSIPLERTAQPRLQTSTGEFMATFCSLHGTTSASRLAIIGRERCRKVPFLRAALFSV
jgi:hypothetical protein